MYLQPFRPVRWHSISATPQRFSCSQATYGIQGVFSPSLFPGKQSFLWNCLYLHSHNRSKIFELFPLLLSPKACLEDGARLACQASRLSLLQSLELPWDVPLCSLLSAAVKCLLFRVKFSQQHTSQNPDNITALHQKWFLMEHSV